MSDKVTIYLDANYSGPSQELSEGSYDVESLKIGNDQLSSLKVPSGMKVTVFEHGGFTGRTKVFVQDSSFVGSDFNDLASSIKVERMSSARVLTIKSIKCIKPSSGIDDTTRAVFGAIGATAGVGFTIAGATATGGALILLAGKAALAGGSGSITALEQFDKWFSGTDDLYVKANGQKIWPSGKYEGIEANQTKNVELKIPFNSSVGIELYDYDSGSADDLLGSFGFQDVTASFQAYVYPQTNDEGAAYQLYISVD